MTQDFWSCEQYDAEAQRLYEEGEYDAALELLKEGLSLYPASTELLVSIGYARLARDEYAWARNAFQEALTLEPEHEEALAGMGEILLKLGERGRAFLLFERLLELGFGRDVDLMLCVGRILYREGLHAKAARFFRIATEADPECADAAAELAYALHRLGDGDETLRWSRRAIELDPSHHEVRAFIGGLLYERGEFPAALDHLERVPPERLWDPVAAWRTVELLRRLRGHDADAPEVEAFMRRLDELTVEPSPEEQLLEEVESRFGGAAGTPAVVSRNQLDLFAWMPASRADELHRVRDAEGRVYEGDWASIVRAMRDGSADPSASIDDYMRDQARRLHNLTGVMISWDDPAQFIEESARVGVLTVER